MTTALDDIHFKSKHDARRHESFSGPTPHCCKDFQHTSRSTQRTHVDHICKLFKHKIQTHEFFFFVSRIHRSASTNFSFGYDFLSSVSGSTTKIPPWSNFVPPAFIAIAAGTDFCLDESAQNDEFLDVWNAGKTPNHNNCKVSRLHIYESNVMVNLGCVV